MRTSIVLVAMCAALLASCGGGASVTIIQVQDPPAATHSPATALFNEGTSLQALAHAYLASEAIVLIQDGAAYLAQPLSLQTRTSGFTCGGGGSVAASYLDADASASLSPGDRIDYVFSGCGSSAFWLDNGTMSLTVVRVAAGDIADFDLVVNGVDVTSGTAFGDAMPRVAGTLLFRSSGTGSLVVTAPGGLSINVAARGAHLNVTNLKGEIVDALVHRTGTALTVSGLAGAFDLAFGSGSLAGALANVDIAGAVPNDRFNTDGPLQAGQLVARGAGGAQARLSGTGTGFTVARDLDANGTTDSSLQYTLAQLLGSI